MRRCSWGRNYVINYKEEECEHLDSQNGTCKFAFMNTLIHELNILLSKAIIIVYYHLEVQALQDTTLKAGAIL